MRHILVKSKALADDIHGQLRSGGDFAALAKKHSTDSGSKDIGGKLTIRKGETVPPVREGRLRAERRRDLEAGQDAYGWHVIEALDRRDGRQARRRSPA